MRPRTLLVLTLLAALVLATPATGDETSWLPQPVFKKIKTTIDLGAGHKLSYALDPNLPSFQPNYTVLTIAAKGREILTTKGDPLLFIGGIKIGNWPYKHMTYKLKNGLEIVGHADKEDGNVHSMEVYRPDGTMLVITGLDTGKVKTRRLGHYSTWLRKRFRKKTCVLILN